MADSNVELGLGGGRIAELTGVEMTGVTCDLPMGADFIVEEFIGVGFPTE